MKNELTPIEKLREEKARLTCECAEQEQHLLERVGYARENFGRLLIGSVFSSTKSGFGDIFSLFTGGKKSRSRQKEDEDIEEESSISRFAPMLMGAAPLIWEVVQPMLIGLVVKKIKSLFTKKKKKVIKNKKASE
ncbi:MULTISPECIES: hypothetical protein [Dysgonomonas]|uniref:hypothetical protein n=1 Tax=Dysgonomonas TaxID=156973 RepID=UPI00291D3A5E|nr:hypothetical protein DCPSUM001_05600 [Dysgonomonas capnocytophagoides]